ncbi:MAG: DUF3108 domain-containing protein [Bacteroidota bacterium]
MSRIRFKSWYLICLLPMLLAFSPAVNERSIELPEPCSTTNEVFSAGEEIVYKIYYNWNFVWLSAGEVTFRVYDEGDEYHISAKGRTYDSYEWFFKVRDNYDSYIDKETLLPRLHIRDVNEGSYERYDKVEFDQTARTAVSKRGRNRDDATPESFDLNDCMHDILSSVYYMRNVDVSEISPGDKLPVKIFFDRKVYPLNVKYHGNENKTRVKGMGNFRTYRFSPDLIAGEVFKEGDEMNVYISADQNKIPVLIESPVSVGSVKVVLKSYKGLRYDFTAKN